MALRLLIHLLGLLPLLAFGSESDLELNPLKASVELETSRLAPGAIVPVTVNLDLHPDFYVYLDSLQLKGQYPAELEFGELDVSPQVEFWDSISQSQKLGIQNTAKIQTVLKIPEEASPAKGELHFRLRHQACTTSYCLFPKWLDLQVPVQWVAAEAFYTSEEAPPPKAVRAQLLSQDWKDVEQAFGNNLMAALALIFAFGFLTSLTPCVYPMIPITLAVLGVQGEKRSWPGRLALSLSYVLGVSTIYTSLGIFAALTGALFGSYLGHPVVVTALAVIFVFLGLSSWGLFSFDLTRFFQPKTPKSKGLAPAYITGIFAGFLASPCVGPVLFGVLAYIGQSRDVGLGALSLFIYSLGFGVLFVALGLFSGLRKHIPSSGSWMEWINKAFGALFLALALYYLNPLLSTAWMLLLSGVLALLLAASLKRSAKNISGQLLRLFVFLLLLGVGFSSLVLSFQLWLSPAPEVQLAEADAYGLRDYTAPQMEAALAQGTPVMIDFYADWCFACVEINNKVFTQPAVQERLSQMAAFKVDLTRSPARFQEVMEQYNVQTLPTLIFIDSKGVWREDLTLRQFENAEQFAQRLDQILEGAPGDHGP